ncbi:DUF6221 family protein [Streptomyces sp. NPDC049627]|uniref:DUF6221 family protein n=1 Tax=Streptomyces sp. NPDC049627 TaxID=3365595 RepID=UPI00378A625E
MIDDLVVFLRARLDEDEEIARKATARQPGGETWMYDGTGVRAGSDLKVAWPQVPVIAEHIARHDPARVLAEIDAKRQVIAPYAVALEERESVRARMRKVLDSDQDEFMRLHRQESELIETARVLAPAVQALALPYADHTDYREDWRP